jgi:hypothetical protein
MCDSEEDFVYGELIFGLGNQMFILAAAYVVHKMNNLPLYILPSGFKNTLIWIFQTQYIFIVTQFLR